MSKSLPSTRLRQLSAELPSADPSEEVGLLPLIDTVALETTPGITETPPLSRDVLLSTAEAAAFFNREPRTLHRWRQRDLIRAVRIGRALFYVAADIDALIARRLSADILCAVPALKIAGR